MWERYSLPPKCPRGRAQKINYNGILSLYLDFVKAALLYIVFSIQRIKKFCLELQKNRRVRHVY